MTLRIVRRCAPDRSEDLSTRLHPVLRRIYAARGIHSDTELSISLERLLAVGTLEGVDAATELLLRHRDTGRVLVIGDFDADGATSSALVVRALRSWAFAFVDFLVPNRFEFGYGLTPEIVELAATRDPSLIITVDNGISSISGVEAARARGISVLVTDHHLPGNSLPAADVIVNPNLAGCAFGSRNLAGVGVAFYVMAALWRTLESTGALAASALRPAELLDLVALGTVADLVPLDANNRVLVAQGLKRIRNGRCVPGIRALLDVAKRHGEITAADLAFSVAPRLNAAGRIDDMTIGIQCLLADEPAMASMLAGRLDQLNQERRSIEARMQTDALAAVRQLKDPALASAQRSGVCLFHESWHQGVVGLVASRVKDQVRKPVVAFARAKDGQLRGSARSVTGIHIRDVLDAITVREPDLIERFGGHAMAAGLTLSEEKLDRFARAFDAEVVRWMRFAGEADAIETDGELGMEEIALETAHALRDGGPWGQAFPEPSFDGAFLVRSSRIVGEKHLKMWVEISPGGRTFDAIAFNHFNAASPAVPPEGRVQLVYRLDVNEYQGERRLQLLVDHVLPA